jgi:hypothetical protein
MKTIAMRGECNGLPVRLPLTSAQFWRILNRGDAKAGRPGAHFFAAKAIRQEAEAPTPSIWPKLSLEWDPL